MVTSACITVPPGPSIRMTSSAPSADLRKSISFATPLTLMNGVTVWYPSGIGLTALLAIDDYSSRDLELEKIAQHLERGSISEISLMHFERNPSVGPLVDPVPLPERE